MIFLDRGDEIVVPLGMVVESDTGTWYFDDKAAERLWHKSALGIPVEGGGINLTSVEFLFCINHRNISSPNINFLIQAIRNDSALIAEYAALEALRTPGNKVVLKKNLDSLSINYCEKSWGLRWESDKHPTKDLPVSEVRWFRSEDEFDDLELFEWVREVESLGRIAESIVVDEELSVVTYHLSTADPRGDFESPFSGGRMIISDYESAETSTGGIFLMNAQDWPLEGIGIPTQGGRQLDWVEREIMQYMGNKSMKFDVQRFSTGPINSELGMTQTASLLMNLWKRGLNTRSGFKFGTTWRCYTGSVGEGHAPWLINDPDDQQKTVGVWAKACLTSRLASGVNKHWICPVDIGSGDWRFLQVSRPPADCRWSNPR